MADNIYKDIAKRCGGNIYLGVVGPVRTGKSTFIKRFMEQFVLPGIENEAVRNRAVDELPQSAAGRTIMTTEPKFIPEQAVQVNLGDGVTIATRLVDCVGYMVPGAMGITEDGGPRLVKSPWFDEEVPFDVAAETGTRKVIAEHATIGVVVTTDGTISDLGREQYASAEERIISELQELGKPFVVLLNCTEPGSPRAIGIAAELSAKYGSQVVPVNCTALTAEDIAQILKVALYAFPIKELRFEMPRWVTMLEGGHWLQSAVYSAVSSYAAGLSRINQLAMPGEAISLVCDYVKEGRINAIDFGTGAVAVTLVLAQDLFYQVLGENTGLSVYDEASLLPCIINLTKVKKQYEKIRDALEQVEATGYGIVMPAIDELILEEPEIMRQGGKYGVRLKASAPSIHMLRVNIATEVSPIVGSETQSQELVMSMLEEFEEDPLKIWESNIFGKSLNEMVNDGMRGKLMHMPQDAREKLQETLERVINEGCQGLICIIL